MLNSMQSANVKTLVFICSATVYCEPQYFPLVESHPTSATNPYGCSKLHIEGMLKDIAMSNTDWRIASLRYFNPVGAYESVLIGDNPSRVPNNHMPYIAQVAAGQRAFLSVFGNDYPAADGTGVRDYVHVMDLAEGHSPALNFLSLTAECHAINLMTGNGYSVLEMVLAFEKASGCEVPFKVFPLRAGDAAQCYYGTQKAADLLYWTAKRSLDEMCESSWRFQHQDSECVVGLWLN